MIPAFWAGPDSPTRMLAICAIPCAASLATQGRLTDLRAHVTDRTGLHAHQNAVGHTCLYSYTRLKYSRQNVMMALEFFRLDFARIDKCC